jgi:hypothetical protein
MRRAAIILAITLAFVSVANAADVSPVPNAAETTTAPPTTAHPHTASTHHRQVHHHYHHHRFHPVHETSKIFHDVTGTKPVYPKPVTN